MVPYEQANPGSIQQKTPNQYNKGGGHTPKGGYRQMAASAARQTAASAARLLDLKKKADPPINMQF